MLNFTVFMLIVSTPFLMTDSILRSQQCATAVEIESCIFGSFVPDEVLFKALCVDLKCMKQIMCIVLFLHHSRVIFN